LLDICERAGLGRTEVVKVQVEFSLWAFISMSCKTNGILFNVCLENRTDGKLAEEPASLILAA
jgi:hypothetical protein